MINCAAAFGGYGFTFGNYPYSCAFNHPITLINCCDEQNIHLPLFNSCGDKDGQLHGRQEVTMIAFNCERVAAHAPGGRLGDLMRKVKALKTRRGISVRTVLVYDGILEPRVEGTGFFDAIVRAGKLLG